MKLTQVPVIIEDVKTSKEKNCLKVLLITQELKPEEAGLLFDLHQKAVTAVFVEAKQVVDPEDLDIKDISYDKDEKTPSQKLRAVLYVWWEQTKKTDTFEQFYRENMEKIINKVKDKLD